MCRFLLFAPMPFLRKPGIEKHMTQKELDEEQVHGTGHWWKLPHRCVWCVWFHQIELVATRDRGSVRTFDRTKPTN